MDEKYKTFYEGEVSYNENFSASLKGEEFAPSPQGSNSKGKQSKKANVWKENMKKEINKRIRAKKLLPLMGEQECVLFVNFDVYGGKPQKPDVDNLLKSFLDALNKQTDHQKLKSKISKQLKKDAQSKSAAWVRSESKRLADMEIDLCKYLVKDDGLFRRIHAERNLVGSVAEQGVEIQYFRTKNFHIDNVEPVGIDIVRRYFRQYWNDSVNLITAHEIVGKDSFGPYKFIDNMPGRLSIVSEAENKYIRKIPPGYDWKAKEGTIVEGCMVLMRVPDYAPDGDEQDLWFWGLTKWS